MKAKFNHKEVKVLLKSLPRNAEVLLVGDDGVYLMSFAQDKTARTIVYAIGMNPKKDAFDTWWKNKNRIFGGDDGGDAVGTAGSLLDLWACGKGESIDEFFINITPNTLAAGVALKRRKVVA